jgi:hypothetical protein
MEDGRVFVQEYVLNVEKSTFLATVAVTPYFVVWAETATIMRRHQRAPTTGRFMS